MSSHFTRLKLSARVYASIFLGAVVVLIGIRAYADGANISNVVISDLSQNSATVSWSTDVNTDALINYGLDANVSTVRDPTFTSKTHSLVIPNLDPGTTYHFRVVSTDESGNKSATAGFVLTTKGTPADKVVKDIKQVTNPDQLKQVVDAVNEQTSNELLPPSIIGAPNVTVTESTAVISWTSDRESSSNVDFAKEADYQPDAKNPYNNSQGNPGDSTKTHKVTVIGLDPVTTYHFRVSSLDSYGLTGYSEDTTFQTKSKLPVIQNLKISRVQEQSAVISWDTSDVLAKGIVSYTNLRTKKTVSAGNPVFATNQKITLTGLEFGTRYQAVVTATDEAGDNVDSKPLTFVTVRDVVPPQISKVKNESTLFPDDDSKVQTIISWNTDEPAYCQVFYTQGLVKKTNGNDDSLQPETAPVVDHLQVIVGFIPGSVYKFWMKCHDVSQNETQSDDYVLITPVREQSIIDLILANFQGTFGWVGKVGKK